jgi:hypothetical protein
MAGAVREIRDRHEHVKVVGSLNLVQSLLREKLCDRLDGRHECRRLGLA